MTSLRVPYSNFDSDPVRYPSLLTVGFSRLASVRMPRKIAENRTEECSDRAQALLLGGGRPKWALFAKSETGIAVATPLARGWPSVSINVFSGGGFRGRKAENPLTW